MKLIVEDKEGGGVLIGVTKDGCDPFMASADGTLVEALAVVPHVIDQAEEKWQSSPRNPDYKAPEKPKAKAKAKATESKETQNKTDETEELPLLAGASTISPTEIPEEGTTEQEKTETQDPATEETPDGVETPSEGQLEVRKCRVCGCTDLNACEGGCSWVEDDLCSNCEGKETATAMNCEEVNREPGLYLKDGRGPFNVQAALDALGLPQDKRPKHNRYSRLSKELQDQIVVQE